MLVEYALRRNATAISSVASSSALRMTSNLIGSMGHASRVIRQTGGQVSLRNCSRAIRKRANGSAKHALSVVEGSLFGDCGQPAKVGLVMLLQRFQSPDL